MKPLSHRFFVRLGLTMTVIGMFYALWLSKSAEMNVQSRIPASNAKNNDLEQTKLRIKTDSLTQADESNSGLTKIQQKDAEWSPPPPFKRFTVAEAKNLFADSLAGKITNPNPGHTSTLMTILASVNPSDGPELIEALSEFPDSEDKNNLISGLLGNLMKEQPVLALSLIEGMPSHPQYPQLVWSALKSLAETNPQAALSEMETLSLEPGQVRREAYRQVFLAWAKADPSAATLAAANLPPGEGRDSALSTLTIIKTGVKPKPSPPPP